MFNKEQIEEIQHLYKKFNENKNSFEVIENYRKLNEALYPILPEILSIVLDTIFVGGNTTEDENTIVDYN